MRAELALMSQRVDKNMVYVTHDQIEAMTLGDRIVVMRAGKIMQHGTPEELFRSPANLFVASFIGSPPMNFVPGELMEEAGRLHVRGDGFDVPLPASRAALGGGRRVTVGIRPSGFTLLQGGDAPGAIDLPVILSEYVGAQSVLMTDLGAARIAIEAQTARPIKVGETVRVAIDPDQVHLFDPDTEAAL